MRFLKVIATNSATNHSATRLRNSPTKIVPHRAPLRHSLVALPPENCPSQSHSAAWPCGKEPRKLPLPEPRGKALHQNHQKTSYHNFPLLGWLWLDLLCAFVESSKTRKSHRGGLCTMLKLDLKHRLMLGHLLVNSARWEEFV